METKILVIGDPHFKTNNIEECNLMCSQIMDWIQKTNPHAVVCLGDVLDRHETIHVGPYLRSVSFFEKIAETTRLYILIGNHDRPNNQVYMTEEHPFTPLKQWKNTTIVDKTVKDTINQQEFVFVPYVPPGRFSEALEITPNDYRSARAIFAHQEFYGAKMGATESLIGDQWDLKDPLVISGHIHDFDRLQENIIYTGTPIQHAYGDREDKGVFLFYFSDKNNSWRYERLELSIPIKKIVKIDCSEIDFLKKLDSNVHYKIIISGTPDELKSLKLSPYISKLLKCKISYKTISTLGIKSMDDNLESRDFLELLYDEIKNTSEEMEQKSEMILSFQELFGKIGTEIVYSS
jgi:predicted phosphodiesterase